MKLSAKFRLVLVHALLLGVLTFLSFLGALTLYLQFMPGPVASAMMDLTEFAPIMGVGGFVIGIIQALLNLWLYQKNFAAFWVVNAILVVLFGGLASFFSIWVIWLIITLLNVFLVWFFVLLLQRELNKTVKDMPT